MGVFGGYSGNMRIPEEKKEIFPPQSFTMPIQDKKHMSKVVLFAFLGSFLGSLLSAVIGVFLC